jgi:hypothetical protein
LSFGNGSRGFDLELRFFGGSGIGAAYRTAKSGVGVLSMGVMRPELVMKSIVPVVLGKEVNPVRITGFTRGNRVTPG